MQVVRALAIPESRGSVRPLRGRPARRTFYRDLMLLRHRAAAAVLAGDFYGSVEIQIQNGVVHVVKVVQTLKESDKGDNP
jgi:hypothetical protein